MFNVEILDTAGTVNYLILLKKKLLKLKFFFFFQETFTAMRDLYIKNSNGFALIYSITSQSTFDQLQSIYDQIMNVKV